MREAEKFNQKGLEADESKKEYQVTIDKSVIKQETFNTTVGQSEDNFMLGFSAKDEEIHEDQLKRGGARGGRGGRGGRGRGDRQGGDRSQK